MRKEVSVTQAKAQLARLLKDASEGHDIVITKHGKPVARLIATAQKRTPGGARGRVWIAPNFNDPLPDDLLEAFGA